MRTGASDSPTRSRWIWDPFHAQADEDRRIFPGGRAGANRSYLPSISTFPAIDSPASGLLPQRTARRRARPYRTVTGHLRMSCVTALPLAAPGRQHHRPPRKTGSGPLSGVILIGMPGIEKRLARYPQLYSRIGFAHHYRTLSTDELTFVLTNRWQELGLSIDPQDFTDAEAIAAVARITNGNFRLIQRLFTQIMRIRDINQLHSITKEAVEAARETLLIGT
jgi:hypothetical protein